MGMPKNQEIFSSKQLAILTLIVMVLLLPGCTDEKNKKIADLTKKVEEQSKSIEEQAKQKEQDVAKQDMALQEECGKNALQFINRAYPAGNHYYTNHYNKRLNKCFILGEDRTAKLKTKLMMDINENKTYAEFDFYDNAVASCNVGGIRCYSESQWDALVKPYMEE